MVKDRAIRIQLFALVATGIVLVGCSDSTPSIGGTPVQEISVIANQPVEPVTLAQTAQNDWPWWRGPNGNGIAHSPQPPLKWTASKNVIWEVPVPGRGHSSPTVVGNHVYLATADEKQQIQSVLCFERETGLEVWKKDLHRGGFPDSVHSRNTHASCTMACDGERLFVAFLNGNAIWATALDLDGEQVWQKKLGGFESEYGYPSSPAIHQSLVIFAADHLAGGYLAALHRKTGKIRWLKKRPTISTCSSPVIAHVAGQTQLLISGADRVMSYDPQTGNVNWSVEGAGRITCGTMVAAGDLVFASGGYPSKETLCVRGDGSEEVVWRNRQKIYVPSMLVHNGYLYAVQDDGIVFCWNAKTGQEAWKKRLTGDVSASPLLMGGHIYVVNECGKLFVFQANPRKFQLVAENQLGDEAFATPAICGGRIFIRVADRSTGMRQEILYCIGIDDAE